jgi:hypothetical protein
MSKKGIPMNSIATQNGTQSCDIVKSMMAARGDRAKAHSRYQVIIEPIMAALLSIPPK